MEPQTFAPKAPTGKKILVIEDERFISELYARALTSAGYHVTVEIDGRRGLELAKTNQFDIVLLDLMLPTMGGSDILFNLRNLNEIPQLRAKIVVITNLEQSKEERAQLERLADAYIIKAEVTPHELVDFLDKLQ